MGWPPVQLFSCGNFLWSHHSKLRFYFWQNPFAVKIEKTEDRVKHVNGLRLRKCWRSLVIQEGVYFFA